MRKISKILFVCAVYIAVFLFATIAMADSKTKVSPPKRNLLNTTSADYKVFEPTRITIPEHLSFGSEKILKGCWNAKDLLGKDADRTVVRPYQSGEPNKPAKLIPQYTPKPLQPNQYGSIRSVVVPTGTKVVALTFDLCERANERTGYDARIINYLRRNKIKATFFAGGKWMRSHPQQAKQLIADPLFEIGNHAWTHGNLRQLHGANLSNQVLWTQAQYELLRQDLVKSPCAQREGVVEIEKIPKIPYVFRFPYGTCDSEALNFLAEKGLAAIQWNVVTGDPTPKQTSGAIVKEVINKSKSGSIIIMHANGRGRATADALQAFVPRLTTKGFRFVTVSELLKSGHPQTAQECYELKPGDNIRYDRIFGEGTQ